MSKSPLRNIPLKTFREYLKWEGLYYVCTNEGHEIWKRKDLFRTVAFPTYVDPISEMAVKLLD